MTDTLDPRGLLRPIVGIENRSAQEVLDIMCDRFRLASRPARVGVKALEWEDRSGAHYAETAFGEVCIDMDGDGFYVIESGRKHSDFATVEDAKAFVQKNHNRWVSDWLEPSALVPAQPAGDKLTAKELASHLAGLVSDNADAAAVERQAEVLIRRHFPAQPAGGEVEPFGYVDRHRQNFAPVSTHGHKLRDMGWTPVYTHPSREVVANLMRAAQRVDSKYGVDAQGHPLDWTEWRDVRDACATLSPGPIEPTATATAVDQISAPTGEAVPANLPTMEEVLGGLHRLHRAGKEVLAGLDARIDTAPSIAKPVFNGIADLHDELNHSDALLDRIKGGAQS